LIAGLKERASEFPSVPVYAFPDTEPRAYASELALLFLPVGIDSRVLEGRPEKYAETGVVADPDNIPGAAKKFAEGLAKCGIVTNWIKWFSPINGRDGKPLPFDLLVSAE
jgi:hypothetical protein